MRPLLGTTRLVAVLGLAAILGLVWMMIEAARRPRPERAELPAVVSGEGYPLRLVLPWGGEVVLEDRPTRILPANAGAVDLLSVLVDPARVAALPSQADEWSRLAAHPEGFEHHARFDAFDAETILSHAPDLLVTSPFNSLDTANRLAEAGVPVLGLPDTFDLDSVVASLEFLGRVLDAERTAREVIDDLRRREAALAERSAARPPLRTIAYFNFGFGGTGSGANTSQNEILRLAGLRNLLAEEGVVGAVKIEYEELLAYDPDLIVVGERDDGGTGVTEELLLAEASLSGLRAVRERRILSLPSRLLTAVSQEILRGGEILSAQVDDWLATR